MSRGVRQAVFGTLRRQLVRNPSKLCDEIFRVGWVFDLPIRWDDAGRMAKDRKKLAGKIESHLAAACSAAHELAAARPRGLLAPRTQRGEPDWGVFALETQHLLEEVRKVRVSMQSAAQPGRPMKLGDLHVGLWIYGCLVRHDIRPRHRFGLLEQLLGDFKFRQSSISGLVRRVRLEAAKPPYKIVGIPKPPEPPTNAVER
jgi:hypothetical protein